MTNCDKVISIKQYGPTCWFNALLMAILYSDNSRKLLLEKSKKWSKKIEVLNTISYILRKKYMRTSNIYKDYLYFDKIRPEYILKKLYKYNKKKFVFDPIKNKKEGFQSKFYIRKLYKLLGVKVLFLDYYNYDKKLYYSFYNNYNIQDIKNNRIKFFIKYKSINTINEAMKNPDIIIININSDFNSNNYIDYYLIDKEKYKNLYENLINLNTNINYENCNYNQDSVLLNNWNKSIGGHTIAGIKCKNDKYVYNGWTRSTIDQNILDDYWLKKTDKDTKKVFYYNEKLNKTVDYNNLPKNAKVYKNDIEIPCQLMKYNWDLEKNSDFCLNLNKCKLDIMSTMKDLCFSFNKGDRTIIYVKEGINKIPKNPLSKPEKKCPDGKVINPLTNRCIKIKTINKIPKNPLSKPEKKCPEGKVINPLTNRCIKKN